MRTSGRDRRLRGFVAVLTCVAITSAARANLMVTNAAGVRAGITEIVYRPSFNTIAVKWAVVDPTTTNVTAFTFQQSSNLTNWVTSYPTNTVTGSASGEASDIPNPTPQFYRMQLINF